MVIFAATGIEGIIEAVTKAIESALGVSLLDMFIQIAATVILVIIVKKFLWGKVTLFLEKKEQSLANELTDIENAKSAALNSEQQAKEELRKLQASKSEIISQAKHLGEVEKQSIVEAGKHEASRLIKEANLQLDHEVKKAKAELTNEIVDLASMIAKKMIEQEIDPDQYTDVVAMMVAPKDQ